MKRPFCMSSAVGAQDIAADRRIFYSFSGGESSGEMTLRDRETRRPGDELLVMFANTGQEDERTLQFVDRCDREYGLGIVWVEAVVNPQHRKATTHRRVTFETATRNGRLFEEMIRKYGIPNQSFPHCTRELKLRPMSSYLRSIGWAPGTYTTCIGIRADEVDRRDPDAKAKRYDYPLIRAGVRKPDVHAAWDARPFRLGLPEHRGNCKTCMKKSPRKLLTLTQEVPEHFEVFRYLERAYPYAGAGDGPRRFFRGNKTTDDLFAQAALGFEPFVDSRNPPAFDPELDSSGSCGESCEPYGDERSPQDDIEDVFA